MNGVTFFFDWEIDLIIWMQSICGPVVNTLATALTLLGEELFLIAVLGYFYWCGDKRLARSMGFSLITSLIFGSMLKNVFLRRRPYFDNESIRCIRAPHAGEDIYDIAIQDYSFPSLHASMSVAMFFPLANSLRKTWAKVFFFLLPFLIGLSRIILGAHYPTDVLAGWVLGFAAYLILSLLQKKTDNSLILWAALSLLALPGWFFCRSNEFFTIYGIMWGLLPGLYVEDRFIHFENTRSPIRTLLRLLGGVALFLAITAVLKLPFPSALLEADSLQAHLIRSARYFIGTFFVIAVYPILFRYTARIGASAQ